MLNRITAWVGLAAAVVACALAPAAPAQADYWVCPPIGDCYVVVETPPAGGTEEPGDGGGGGGDPQCIWRGQPVACWQAGYGHFNSSDGCYYILESPQPAAGDPAWAGHEPGDGAVYRARCNGDVIGDLVWRATPPPGTPGGLTPAQLAARAIEDLPMRGATIGLRPDPDGAGLVGLPIWMWTEVTPQTWGPITATASVPGLSVTARGNATRITWDMGDGSRKVCHNPGTAYDRGRHGAAASPTCGYDGYQRSSRNQPGGRYQVTAVTTWHVEWWMVGGGTTGTETITRTATTSIDIDELQVVTE
ncbi:hypothetical protein O7627_27450 [Solwaraspora sp. WMMD1047]|uniref:hypothetical protein n=1 Tax=Solwaraspora sp. WMMD1047 TaxID=3016102 RepID=UPI002415BCED|nr:hypothetical protein [Solwaraspora sp. WMMD1047]MDG4833013.1 hypothetical protein [Solwaraspora sp. WMMD1047]